MPADPYQLMVDQFRGVDDQLLADASTSKGLSNPTDVGTEREVAVMRMLERFLPSTCQLAQGGFLFNIRGDSSRQVDLIATGGNAPCIRSNSGNIAVAPVEDTVAVVEVKSKLDKNELNMALNNFASIPSIDSPDKRTAPYIKKPPDYFWWDWPYKLIVGFDGIRRELLVQYIQEFYDSNPDIPFHRRPSMIYIVKKYSVRRMSPDYKIVSEDGASTTDQPPIGTYRSFCERSNGAALMSFLMETQKRLFVGRNMLWPYEDGINNVAERAMSAPAAEDGTRP